MSSAPANICPKYGDLKAFVMAIKVCQRRVTPSHVVLLIALLILSNVPGDPSKARICSMTFIRGDPVRATKARTNGQMQISKNTNLCISMASLKLAVCCLMWQKGRGECSSAAVGDDG
jgi:hypothetical protein